MSDITYTVKIESNLDLAEQELDKAKEKCLYAMGVLATAGAVESISGHYNPNNLAVDTGRLRASISFITASGEQGRGSSAVIESKVGDVLIGKAQKDSVYVGSNVNYAEYVHDGTSRMAGRPFLREGIDRKKEEIEKTIKEILKGEK